MSATITNPEMVHYTIIIGAYPLLRVHHAVFS